MFKHQFLISLLCCLWAMTGYAAIGSALDRSAIEASALAVFQAGGMSLDQAVAMVQAKYGARVMRANTVVEEGRTVHYVRLITNDRARVFTVRVDAASGREF